MLGAVRAVSLAAITASLLFGMVFGTTARQAAAQQMAQQTISGITRADFDAIHADFFFGADLDFNLSLTAAEIDTQLRRSSSEERGIVAIDSYDADGDGVVTYDEFTTGAAAEFHRRDLNGDGVITPDEF
jgi:hypothetical protein